MELLKQKGINTRKVGWGIKKGHFLTEVYYGNSWHLYDVNKEPNWTKVAIPHQSMAYYQAHPDSLFIVYQNKIEKNTFNEFLSHVSYDDPNEFPAKKMLFFHQITKIITYLLPCIFGILFLFNLLKSHFQLKIKTYKHIIRLNSKKFNTDNLIFGTKFSRSSIQKKNKSEL